MMRTAQQRGGGRRQQLFTIVDDGFDIIGILQGNKYATSIAR